MSLHSQYILCIQFQEVIVPDTYRPHLVVNVVVAAEPAVAVHPTLDGIQPSFSGCIHVSGGVTPLACLSELRKIEENR